MARIFLGLKKLWSEEIWSKNILYTKIMTPKKLRPKSLVKIIPVTAEIQPTWTNVARAYVLPGYMSPYQLASFKKRTYL